MDKKYVAQEGDLVMQPMDDDSPDALLNVIPADKTKKPFWIERKNLEGFPKSHYSVGNMDIPEGSGGDLYLFNQERPSPLPVMFIGAISGALVGVVIGILIGVFGPW